jgi:hypothetical protein
MNPIIAMLHDIQNNRYHPIIFLEHPLPGKALGEEPVRHKSKGHHTTGFATREEALADAQNEEFVGNLRANWGEPRFALANDLPWDGKGIPAMVVWFAEVGGELTPVF